MTDSLSSCQVIEGSSRTFLLPISCKSTFLLLFAFRNYPQFIAGLVEGEAWSGDEDAHNKAAINGGRKENDMFHKKLQQTHKHLLKWLLLPEVLKRIVNPLTCLFQVAGPKSFKHSFSPGLHAL